MAGRPPGSKNRTPAELKRDAEIALAKAKLKILEQKKAEELRKKQQQKSQLRAQMMPKKPAGYCPFCRELVTPEIVEENTFRRDKCVCDNKECKKTVYVCRTPGCDDFTKGGSIYDDELCPGCTKNVSTTLGGALLLTLFARTGL